MEPDLEEPIDEGTVENRVLNVRALQNLVRASDWENTQWDRAFLRDGPALALQGAAVWQCKSRDSASVWQVILFVNFKSPKAEDEKGDEVSSPSVQQKPNPFQASVETLAHWQCTVLVQKCNLMSFVAWKQSDLFAWKQQSKQTSFRKLSLACETSCSLVISNISDVSPDLLWAGDLRQLRTG